jgi:hypothetical protein
MGFAVTRDTGVICSRGPRVACGGLGRVGFVAGDLNKPEYVEDPTGEENAYEQAVSGRNDFAYYYLDYLDNARGQVMALLARDMQYGINTPGEGGGSDQDKARILEYYKYNAFGSVTVLPVNDRPGEIASSVNSSGVFEGGFDDIPGSGSYAEWDLVENTPLTLSDNNTLMVNRRNGDNGHAVMGAGYGRAGAFECYQVTQSARYGAEVGFMFATVTGSSEGPVHIDSDDWAKPAGVRRDPTPFPGEQGWAEGSIDEYHKLYDPEIWTSWDEYNGKVIYWTRWRCGCGEDGKSPRLECLDDYADWEPNEVSSKLGDDDHKKLVVSDGHGKLMKITPEKKDIVDHAFVEHMFAAADDEDDYKAIYDRVSSASSSAVENLAKSLGGIVGDNAGGIGEVAGQVVASLLGGKSGASFSSAFFVLCKCPDGKPKLEIKTAGGSNREAKGEFTWKGGELKIVDSRGVYHRVWPDQAAARTGDANRDSVAEVGPEDTVTKRG